MNWSIKLTAAFALMAFVMSGCKKEDKVVTPPAQAHFTNKTGDTYFITAPGVTYKVPVGVTTVANQDRTFKVTVSSPTGAQRGVQYTIADTVVVIPAGKTLDSLVVAGVYSYYTTGRKDTLIFRIVGQDVPASDYNNQFVLLMRGPCFDGDVTLNDMAGTYANTLENQGGYGPYTTTVTNVQVLTLTTGSAQVSNLWDYFGPVTILFDWTDPANIKVNIPLQQTDKNYAPGQPFLIRTSPGKPNTFSVCSQRISLTVDVIVNNYPSVGSAVYYDQNLDMILNR